MKLTKEIKIALVAIVGILIMYFGINFLKGMNLFSTCLLYTSDAADDRAIV